MRLWCQMPTPVGLPALAEPLAKVLDLAKRKDTEIVVKRPDPVTFDLENLTQRSFRFMNDREILRGCSRAEKENFDAVMIACFFDPALRAARQLLQIPVVGAAESSMHLACMMGLKFAIVTSDARYVPEMTEMLHSYGLTSNTIVPRPVRGLRLSALEQQRCLGSNWDLLVKDFEEVATTCISDGAEVIVVGCGWLSSLLTYQGLREIDKVPVVDPLQVAIKTAETLVDLRNAGLPFVSRKGAYWGHSSEREQLRR